MILTAPKVVEQWEDGYPAMEWLRNVVITRSEEIETILKTNIEIRLPGRKPSER